MSHSTSPRPYRVAPVPYFSPGRRAPAHRRLLDGAALVARVDLDGATDPGTVAQFSQLIVEVSCWTASCGASRSGPGR
jgi:hypothetical protein